MAFERLKRWAATAFFGAKALAPAHDIAVENAYSDEPVTVQMNETGPIKVSRLDKNQKAFLAADIFGSGATWDTVEEVKGNRVVRSFRLDINELADKNDLPRIKDRLVRMGCAMSVSDTGHLIVPEARASELRHLATFAMSEAGQKALEGVPQGGTASIVAKILYNSFYDPVVTGTGRIYQSAATTSAPRAVTEDRTRKTDLSAPREETTKVERSVAKAPTKPTKEVTRIERAPEKRAEAAIAQKETGPKAFTEEDRAHLKEIESIRQKWGLADQVLVSRNAAEVSFKLSVNNSDKPPSGYRSDIFSDLQSAGYKVTMAFRPDGTDYVVEKRTLDEKQPVMLARREVESPKEVEVEKPKDRRVDTKQVTAVLKGAGGSQNAVGSEGALKDPPKITAESLAATYVPSTHDVTDADYQAIAGHQWEKKEGGKFTLNLGGTSVDKMEEVYALLADASLTPSVKTINGSTVFEVSGGKGQVLDAILKDHRSFGVNGDGQVITHHPFEPTPVSDVQLEKADAARRESDRRVTRPRAMGVGLA